MIRPEQVWLAAEPVDLRMGIDGLSLKIQQALGRSPCKGTPCAFRNRDGNRIQLLVWDGTGVSLCVRRLHRGRFTWPCSDDAVCLLTPDEWRWRTCDIDWLRLPAKPSATWRV